MVKKQILQEENYIGIGTAMENSQYNRNLMFKLLKRPMIPCTIQTNQISSSISDINLTSKPISNIKNENSNDICPQNIKQEHIMKIEPFEDIVIDILDSDEEESPAKKHRIVANIDLCDDNEIVISDDEDYAYVKNEIDDIDYFEDEDIICIDEQQQLDKWRARLFRPKLIKSEPMEVIDSSDSTNEFLQNIDYISDNMDANNFTTESAYQIIDLAEKDPINIENLEIHQIFPNNENLSNIVNEPYLIESHQMSSTSKNINTTEISNLENKIYSNENIGESLSMTLNSNNSVQTNKKIKRSESIDKIISELKQQPQTHNNGKFYFKIM